MSKAFLLYGRHPPDLVPGRSTYPTCRPSTARTHHRVTADNPAGHDNKLFLVGCVALCLCMLPLALLPLARAETVPLSATRYVCASSASVSVSASASAGRPAWPAWLASTLLRPGTRPPPVVQLIHLSVRPVVGTYSFMHQAGPGGGGQDREEEGGGGRGCGTSERWLVVFYQAQVARAGKVSGRP